MSKEHVNFIKSNNNKNLTRTRKQKNNHHTNKTKISFKENSLTAYSREILQSYRDIFIHYSYYDLRKIVRAITSIPHSRHAWVLPTVGKTIILNSHTQHTR